MSIKKIALLALLVMTVSLTSGCHWFEDESEAEKLAQESMLPVQPGAGGVLPPNDDIEESGDEEPIEEPVEEPEVTADDIPEDFDGVWLRTKTVSPGFVGSEPATLTLNRESYTSVTSLCSSEGTIDYQGDGVVNMVQQGTDCPKAPQIINVTYKYTIVWDEEREIEVMTIVTGPVTETYDRQS